MTNDTRQVVRRIQNVRLLWLATKVGEPPTAEAINAAVRLLDEVLAALQRTETAQRTDTAAVGSLQALAACAYQLAGYHDAPLIWMDRLLEGANGDPLPDADTLIDELLPYPVDAAPGNVDRSDPAANHARASILAALSAAYAAGKMGKFHDKGAASWRVLDAVAGRLGYPFDDMSALSELQAKIAAAPVGVLSYDDDGWDMVEVPESDQDRFRSGQRIRLLPAEDAGGPTT